MAAPEGNNYNLKYKTSEERQALCQLFCQHLADGFTRESFYHCAAKTVDRYIEEYPEDFPADMIENAYAAQKHKWEKRLADSADGTNNGAPASIKFGLQNINRWTDRHDHTTQGEKMPPVILSTTDGAL